MVELAKTDMGLYSTYFDPGKLTGSLKIYAEGKGYMVTIHSLHLIPVGALEMKLLPAMRGVIRLFRLPSRLFRMGLKLIRFVHLNGFGPTYRRVAKLFSGLPEYIEDYGFINGIKQFIKSIKDLILKASNVYRYKLPEDMGELPEKIQQFKKKPLVSIVMPVYNVSPKWLSLAIDSIRNQVYENWELCIADDCSTNDETKNFLKGIHDPRIKIVFLEKNLNIGGASREASSLATGDYIGLLDNDDEITPDALFRVVERINQTGADLIYSDEDFITTGGKSAGAHFKADYSPDMLLSQNYICHFTVIEKKLFNKVGGFRMGFDGSQDHDLFLRVTEKAKRIEHIPRVLYHWRKIPGSTASEFSSKSYAWDAGIRAIDEALQRRKIAGRAEKGPFPGTFMIRREIPGKPLVSILIPFRDMAQTTEVALRTILEKTEYQNFEIIGIDNGSVEPQTMEMMERYKNLDKRVRFVTYDIPFNFARLNNLAVQKAARGTHILMLNNDIEIIDGKWLGALLENSSRKEVGAVGGLLLYPDHTIQHAGVILGISGVAGHSHRGMEKGNSGYFARPHVVHNVSAVTGAMLMVKKSLYQELGGMDEKKYSVAFNDVDFCLRLMKKGYWNVYTPLATAVHHESLSRGYEDDPEKIERFEREILNLRTDHSDLFESGDPFYNPNLSLLSERFNLA